jgi:hypothetical protein
VKAVLLPQEFPVDQYAASSYGDDVVGLAYSFLPVYLVSPKMPISG